MGADEWQPMQLSVPSTRFEPASPQLSPTELQKPSAYSSGVLPPLVEGIDPELLSLEQPIHHTDDSRASMASSLSVLTGHFRRLRRRSLGTFTLSSTDVPLQNRPLAVKPQPPAKQPVCSAVPDSV